METMVRATTELNDEALTRAVARFKALADRTRLGILTLMVARTDAICVCEVNEFFDLEQPTISHLCRLLCSSASNSWHSSRESARIYGRMSKVASTMVVRHIYDTRRAPPHRLTSFARVAGDQITYTPEEHA
jgi:hypothetical protein